MTLEPALAVLLIAGLAALCGGLGALPWVFATGPSGGWLGAAGALASGLMIGSAYLLMTRGLDLTTWSVVLGAGGGVAYTYGIQALARIDDFDGARSDDEGPEFGYKLLLQSALHSAAEGVAIGVAAVLQLRLGLFIALALAVHNVGETLALSHALRRRGLGVGRAATLGIVVKIPQPLLALAAFALSPVLGGLLPAALGFAAGSLVFLVLTELLPATYQRASSALVSFLVALAAGAVVLLEHFVVG